MVARERIYKETRRLTGLFQTRNPMKIASGLGVHVDFNYGFDSLKGMYLAIKRSRFIVLNGNLSDRDLRTVCAHELGHDRFHQELAKSSFLQEFMLYDMKQRPEYEANIFAADLLIDDDDVVSMAQSGYDVYQIAGELDADVNLVLIKIDGLKRRGYDVIAPFLPQSDFLYS